MNGTGDRFMLTAPASGAGKTTLTVGILRALGRRGCRPAACKCGPDYIDPMFHRRVLGVDGYNLDLFFTSTPSVRGLLARAMKDAGVTVLEGAMGYYDGIGDTDSASAYAVSVGTETPAILVVPAGGAMLSLAALVSGFRHFRPDSAIRGVILNKASASLYEKARSVIEREAGLPVFGYLPADSALQLPSRHLGLVTPDSIDEMQPLLDAIADAVERTVDLDALVELSRTAPDLGPAGPLWQGWRTDDAPVIAVARDEAFSFYYRENLELLEAMGARLEFFSPLRDASLPKGTRGLYLGGGYPEIHAERLFENRPMREAIRSAVQNGLPTLAECGGYLYLHDSLEDPTGNRYPMVGVVQGQGVRTDRLRRFGYVTLTAKRDTVLFPAGGSIRAHEFHYWDSTAKAGDCRAERPNGTGWDSVVATGRLFAGFPHLYFLANPSAAENFIKACLC